MPKGRLKLKRHKAWWRVKVRRTIHAAASMPCFYETFTEFHGRVIQGKKFVHTSKERFLSVKFNGQATQKLISNESETFRSISKLLTGFQALRPALIEASQIRRPHLGWLAYCGPSHDQHRLCRTYLNTTFYRSVFRFLIILLFSSFRTSAEAHGHLVLPVRTRKCSAVELFYHFCLPSSPAIIQPVS